MKSINKYEIIVLISLFIATLWAYSIYADEHQTKDSKPPKVYPVRVYLYGEQVNSYFDCDSANLNYAWKDGIKIQLKDVYQIKFN